MSEIAIPTVLTKELKAKTSRNMLYMGMLSIVMMFAGLTSAYIVSQADNFWVNIELPLPFWISTALIILSSVTINMAYSASKKDQFNKITFWLSITMLLGVAFEVSQYQGYKNLVQKGNYFTGNPIMKGNGDVPKWYLRQGF